MSLWRVDLDDLDLQGFACSPADGSLAGDDFSDGVRFSHSEDGGSAPKFTRQKSEMRSS
jgi:hypothetical protein